MQRTELKCWLFRDEFICMSMLVLIYFCDTLKYICFAFLTVFVLFCFVSFGTCTWQSQTDDLHELKALCVHPPVHHNNWQQSVVNLSSPSEIPTHIYTANIYTANSCSDGDPRSLCKYCPPSGLPLHRPAFLCGRPHSDIGTSLFSLSFSLPPPHKCHCCNLKKVKL